MALARCFFASLNLLFTALASVSDSSNTSDDGFAVSFVSEDFCNFCIAVCHIRYAKIPQYPTNPCISDWNLILWRFSHHEREDSVGTVL